MYVQPAPCVGCEIGDLLLEIHHFMYIRACEKVFWTRQGMPLKDSVEKIRYMAAEPNEVNVAKVNHLQMTAHQM